MAGGRIEDIIQNVLKDEAQKNALDYVSYLKRKGIPFEESENYWEVNYKGECVCFLWISGSNDIPGPWTIWSNQEPGTWAAWGDAVYDDFPIDKGIKEIAWNNVNVCGNCGGCDNPGGNTKIVLGKKFHNLCNSTMAFTNPNGKELDCAKKMIEIRIRDIEKK